MNEARNQFAQWWQRLSLRHPRRAELLAWQDGELVTTRRIAEHLQRCHSCQEELRLLKEDARRFIEIESLIQPCEPDDLMIGKERLLATMRALSASPSANSSLPATVFAQTRRGQAIANELAVYLGARVTDAVLSKVRPEKNAAEEIVAAASPLLNGLLGEAAAQSVSARIVALLETPAPSTLPSPLILP